MHKSEQVVSFLKPLAVAPGISDFDALRGLLKAVPEYTLLPRDFFDAALVALPAYREVLAAGDWAQVGVWKGGGALFFRALMEDMGISRCLHLFDTFGRFPVTNLSQEKDRIFVRELGLLAAGMPVDSYRVAVEQLFADHEMADAVKLQECDINTLPAGRIPGAIAFLHVDVDFYEPTLAALNRFYDRVIPGGLIVIDDYYMELLACKEAVDTFLVGRGVDASRELRRFSSYAAAFSKPDA